jgi:alkanesulfonate monooxygenase SsuD/methylene tetrahydromethanopterin reductase-like flavin-dependent oxidoreductase (luciferase family)
VLEENVERYKECLDILELAWTNDRFDYDGKYYKADQLSVVPKPLQKPHPKIFQVGTSAKWFERAAQRGYASRSAARRRPRCSASRPSSTASCASRRGPRRS